MYVRRSAVRQASDENRRKANIGSKSSDNCNIFFKASIIVLSVLIHEVYYQFESTYLYLKTLNKGRNLTQ